MCQLIVSLHNQGHGSPCLAVPEFQGVLLTSIPDDSYKVACWVWIVSAAESWFWASLPNSVLNDSTVGMVGIFTSASAKNHGVVFGSLFASTIQSLLMISPEINVWNCWPRVRSANSDLSTKSIMLPILVVAIKVVFSFWKGYKRRRRKKKRSGGMKRKRRGRRTKKKRSSDRDCIWPTKPKMFIISCLMGNFCWPLT